MYSQPSLPYHNFECIVKENKTSNIKKRELHQEDNFNTLGLLWLFAARRMMKRDIASS